MPDMEKNDYPLISQQVKANNFELMQQNNRILILRLIKDLGIASRKELSQMSGLTQATITLIINEFLQKNLVEEVGLIGGKNGRKVTGLSIVTNRYCTVAVRITTKYYAIGLYDINSTCMEVEKVPMEIFEDIAVTLSLIKEKIAQLFEKAKRQGLQVLAIAFSLQGYFRFTQKECIMLSKTGYYIDLRVYYEQAFHCPVFYDTGSNYGAYYLACQRDAEYLKDQTVLYLCISYSVEATILYNRMTIKGATTIPGSIGKFLIPCADGGETTFDSIVSTDVITKRAEDMLPDYPKSILHEYKGHMRNRNLIEAFYKGDPIALIIFADVANATGYVIAMMIHVLHPHRVFVTDEIPVNATFERMIVDAVRNHFPRDISYFPEISCLPIKRDTALDSTMRGASMFATNKILKMNEFFQ
jgi:predicted NBD/HSP70 family sugar kinase